MKKIFIIGIVLVLLFAGCSHATPVTTPNEAPSPISHEIPVFMQTTLATPEEPVVSTGEPTSNIVIESASNSTLNTSSQESGILAVVKNGDYKQAYAEALYYGCYVPSEEARKLMDKNEELIENEPRLVADVDEQLHIIWTDKNMLLVVDGEGTNIKVSECIFPDALPDLPMLENLAEYHSKNELARYGIAETAYLEELSEELEVKYLYRVRFYNYNGEAVAVYSLQPDGELYINEVKAENFFAN